MKHVMIDVESIGTTPGSAILSIAAIRFDPRSGDTGSSLYIVVDLRSSLKNGLKVDGDTFYWWMEQSDSARKELNNNPVHVVEAFNNLRLFLQEGDYLWGNSARFDLGLIAAVYEKLNQGNLLPWDRRNEMCHRTLRNLVSRKIWEIPFTGTKHIPMDDCLHQIKQVHEIYRRMKL